jgi:formylglycine-generating enzyme required for sulfatase activity
MQQLDRTRRANRVLTAALVMGVVTPSASAQFTHWHNTENPPPTTGNLWADTGNWKDDAVPGTGAYDAFRIEQYPADASGTGEIIMDFDYSALEPIRVAQFFGGERVLIQNHFKASVGGVGEEGIIFLNGSNNPNGAYLRVDSTGSIEADIVAMSPNDRGKPTIEFAGGSWVGGNYRNWNTGQQTWGRQDVIFSSKDGSITPGSISTWSNRAEMKFIFNLAAGGVTPVILTEVNPLRFTGPSEGTRPFSLVIDMTDYAGAASSIPLFIFQNPDDDRLFEEDNITISGAPADWEEVEVVQNDSGVVLQKVGDADGDDLPDSWEQAVIDADPDDGVAGLEDVDPEGNLDGDTLTNKEEFDAGSDPLDEDTDNDASNDDEELVNGTGVLDRDSDDDGLLDGHETNTGLFNGETDTGTDPLNPNSDGDVVPDGLEVRNGSDPTDPNDPGAGQAVAIDTVVIGSPGNPADGTGFGQVDYEYAIGTYEITVGQYLVFLNAVAAEDTYGLWHPEMDRAAGGDAVFGPDIRRSGPSGSYAYSAGRPAQLNRPMRSGVDYGNAMRFCNWLHNGQPSGAQNASTTEEGAYLLNGASSNEDLANALKARLEGWRYALPTIDEWYKAAYHNPEDDSYFDYPTGSNSQPGYVNDSGNLSGSGDPFSDGGADPGNYATWQGDGGTRGIGPSEYATEAGEWENSASPWGTFDQLGNVDEMIETINEDHGATRPYLVGANAEHPANASAGRRTSVEGGSWNPTDHGRFIGFRIVSANLPAPQRIVLGVKLDPSGQNLVLTWNSREGMLYNLLSDPGLENEPASWGVWMGNENIPADQGGENSLTIPLPSPPDPTRFFAISEFPPPPVVLYSTDFEGGAAGWTTLVNDENSNTAWELGTPAGSTGPVAGAAESANAWSTNLGDYGPDSDISLRSPAIDLSGIAEAELSFEAYRDADGFGDAAVVRFLRASDLEQLGEEVPIDMDVFDVDWTTIRFPVPPEAIGETALIEWNFISDNTPDTYSGLSIDGVRVGD